MSRHSQNQSKITACLGHETMLQMDDIWFIKVPFTYCNSFSHLNVTFIEISYLQLTEKIATFQFTKAFKIMSLLLLPERQLPVPLDKGNEGSEDEITNAVGGQTHLAPTQSKLCSARVRLACGHT